ncbi:MAG: LysM peptidoglycan-binding domain-containing protein [Acidobacteriota bacterium]|nr:LysM peptidoglycan-binding domain-containing protein [Blastocatellia bacterium]MDW8413475.1 LysM peptidoglycan-binding domain-containing protein [Acidobacteriota bacterium]
METLGIQDTSKVIWLSYILIDMVKVNKIDTTSPYHLSSGETLEQYLTRPGDTLQSIAEAFGSDLATLVAANPFIADPNRLPAGVYIKIPSRQDKERTEEKQDDSPKKDKDEKQEHPTAELETVSNNPIANSKRGYELSQGYLSLAFISPNPTATLINLPNPNTTGKATADYLLPDETFANHLAMDWGNIQYLFHEKGSGLASKPLPDGRIPAKVIESAARANKINPQVLVTLLQRDCGFIFGEYSRNIPQEHLEWCFGLGEGRVERLRGFDKQIELMARRIGQAFYENKLRVPTTVRLDSNKQQKVETAATLTVYQFSSGRAAAEAFIDIWRKLFGKAGLGKLLS